MRDRNVRRVASMLGLTSACWGVAATAVAQSSVAPAAPIVAPAAPAAPAAPPSAPAPAPAPAPPPMYPVTPLPPGAIALPPGAPPPPGAVYVYPPPPGYGYPQYGYARPMRAPESVPYAGGPVPTGYHVETRQRRGLIITGALLTAVPWALGLSVASGQDFPNHSGWLVLPAVGPWLTLASRHDARCSSDSDCWSLDPATRTLLVLDGLVQTSGAILFILGVSSPYQVITRDFVGSMHFAPAPIGRQGYGGFLTGDF